MKANEWRDIKNSLRPSSRFCNEMLSQSEIKLNHLSIIYHPITIKVPLFDHNHLMQ